MPKRNGHAIKANDRKKSDVALDDIFFHKSQLKPGTILIHYGRLNPLSKWEVIDIKSHVLGKTVGEVRWKKVTQVKYLSDAIWLRNTVTGEVRKGTFSHMSYSAIWRLAQ